MKKLTSKEKDELARRYVEILPSIKVRKNFSHGFMGIFSAAVLVAVAISGILQLPVLLGVSLVLEVIPFVLAVVNNVWIHDDVKDILDGKISVKDFKLLLKSGELNEVINKFIDKKNARIELDNEEIKRCNEFTPIIDKESYSRKLKYVGAKKRKGLLEKTYKKLLEKKENEDEMVWQ